MQSTIRTMSVECEKVGGVNLAQGVCDTEVPRVVREAAEAAIEAGYNQYTRADGITSLREAIAAKLLRQNGIVADPETEVLVTSGVTGGFDSACRALLNPGDEVILFEPYYGYHYATLVGQYCKPVLVSLDPPDYPLVVDRLAAAITPKTRGIVVNTPANPSGKVFSVAELEQISAVAIHHDLFLFTDEIYEHFVYDGQRHVSPASLPGIAERDDHDFWILESLQHYGLARRIFACLGALVAGHQLLPRSNIRLRAVAFSTRSQSPGWNSCPIRFTPSLIAEYQHKREMICDALRSSGMEPSVPAGAYYVLADASVVPGADSVEKALNLLRLTGVASVPGDAFFQGGRGDHLLRFCFAKTDADLADACERLMRSPPDSCASVSYCFATPIRALLRFVAANNGNE